MAGLHPPVKALFFDVFGTCVDWRKSITDALLTECKDALNSGTATMSSDIQSKASSMTYEDWGELAQEWRNSYLAFTRSIATDASIAYKTVDEHHRDALREILVKRDLILPQQGDTAASSAHDGSLWNDEQITKLSMAWHYLQPWPDTCQGIHALNQKFKTCTLSNGNLALLNDMVKHGGMDFTHVYSAEMWQSYKPNPKVYLGAAEKMGVEPQECMMVAAHLDDLKFAKQCGFRALYVERPREERYPELLKENIPDVWVAMDERGFITAAEKLGIQVSS